MISRHDLVICDMCGVIQPDRDLNQTIPWCDRVVLMCLACRERMIIRMDNPTEEEFEEWNNNTTDEIKRQTELEIQEQYKRARA